MKTFAALLLFSSLALAAPRPLTDLVGSGEPALAKTLGPDGYVSIELTKLANPKLVYIDLEWLREQGFHVPHEGLTPAFEKQLLDLLGYAGRIDGEPDSAYIKGDTVVGKADKHGGFGLGQNGGSGRAASRGIIQCKGCGRTDLVAQNQDKWHSNGAALLSESIKETLASQVTHRELPYGANRVIAVVSTGTTSRAGGQGDVEPRVLIIREDPLRPAHFLFNDNMHDKEVEGRRQDYTLKRLVNWLPQKPGVHFKTRHEKAEAGINEFIDRMSYTHAFMYARGFHHGSLTPSNLEIDMKALDYGAFIQYLGYPKALRNDWVGPFGEHTIEWAVLNQFLEATRWKLPSDVRSVWPSMDQAWSRYMAHYQSEVNLEMTALAGFPRELLTDRALVNALGSQLEAMSREGNHEKVTAYHGQPANTGVYNLPVLLDKMARAVRDGSSLSRAALAGGVRDVAVRRSLVKAYSALLAKMPSGVGSYMVEASGVRNLKNRELTRTEDFWNEFRPLVGEFTRTGDPSALRSALTKTLRDSARAHREPKGVFTCEALF